MMSIVLFFLACFDVIFFFAAAIAIIWGLVSGIREILKTS